MSYIERLLEKYPDDKDILKLLSEKSELHRQIQIISNEALSYKEQLKGLHRFVKSAKLMEKIDEGNL